MRLFIAFAIVCALSAVAVAEIPGAGDRKAFIEQDYRRAMLAFNRRTLSEAYQASGKKDPKWDAAAVTFLDAMAVRFANAGAEDWYKLPGEKPSAELSELARAALDAGCEDPLVVYCHAVILDDTKCSWAEIGPLVQSAAEQLIGGPYPLNRAAAAQHRLHRLTDPHQPERLEEVRKSALDLTIAMIANWKYQDLDRRIILQNASSDYENGPIDREKELVKNLLAAGKVDPWMKEMILGRHEIKLGWAARGQGFADTVTEQGWRRFHDHIARARNHFLAAHALRPEYPEAATGMITVALAAGDRSGDDDDDAREWFDRAVSAQLDYAPAYSGYLWSLRPRWGGSFEQMYAFGVECVQTERFDTRVPWQLCTVLGDIADDAKSPAFYQQPGVYENIKALFDGLIAGAKPPQDVDFYRSYHAALAWRANRYDEACRIFDQLGDKLSDRIFIRVNAMGRLAVSHAYAMRDKLADKINGAESRAARGDLAGAGAGYQQSLDRLPPDSKAGYFLRSRLKQLQWQQQFEQGEWVDIQPDKDFIAWQPIYGKWSVDEAGVLLGVVDESGLWMLCQAPFLTGDFIVEGTIELPGATNTAGGVGFGAPVDLKSYWGVFLRRGGGQGSLNRDVLPPARDAVDLQDKNQFRLSVQGNRISADLNGKAIFRNHAVNYILDQPRYYLGVGNRQNNAGAPVRLGGLRVRALKRGDAAP